MSFYFICLPVMRILHPFLLCILLLIGAARSAAQTMPAAAPLPSAGPAAEAAPDKPLLKIGLNAGRAVRYGGYYGLSARLPLSVGVEHLLSPKFTLYGQLHADFRLARRNEYFGDQNFAIPSGALGMGARYYYNQAGRAQRERPHGPFVGNYLALEAHTEVRRRQMQSTDVAPSLNLLWGTQRRLGRNFLFDFNAGLGLGPQRSDSYLGYSSGSLNVITQLNLGVYFGR